MMLRIRTILPFGLFLLALGGACSETDPIQRGNGAATGADDSEDSSEDDEPPPASTKKDAGKTPSKDAGAKVSDDVPEVTVKDPAPPVVSLKGDLPCDVQALVVSKCGSCHGKKPAGGAPMSLVTLDDFHRPAASDDTRTVDEVSLERMTEKNAARRMPPASVDISAAETKTLTDWLGSGAKGSTAQCSSSEPEGSTASRPASAHSGGVSITPLVYDDPNLKCYKFLGFSKTGDRAKKYDVPTTPDYYVKFDLKPEFKGVQYLKSYKPVIDNSAVLHHWLFYKQKAAGNNGVQENAIGTHPDGELIAGWAPGGDPIYFDGDTGVELSGDVNYQMEMHYNNKTGGIAQDASGVEICVTTTKPAHIAAMGWLGTDSINGTSATGNCKPTNTEPVHLIAATPHMHLLGRHMKVVITRKDGKQEIVHDKDFDFEYQRQYVEDWVINPGDTVQTTCTYSAPARFGKGTNDEMCYFFSTHWPAGSLSMLGSGTIIHGGNSCLP